MIYLLEVLSFILGVKALQCPGICIYSNDSIVVISHKNTDRCLCSPYFVKDFCHQEISKFPFLILVKINISTPWLGEYNVSFCSLRNLCYNSICYCIWITHSVLSQEILDINGLVLIIYEHIVDHLRILIHLLLNIFMNLVVLLIEERILCKWLNLKLIIFIFLGVKFILMNLHEGIDNVGM